MEYDFSVRKKALEHIETHGLAPTHNRIVSLVGSARKVLDLGCATGYLSQALTENGCQVVGIEMDQAAADKARLFCQYVITGDAGDPAVISQAGSDFDFIVCADIIEHLIDPWTVLRTLRQMLAPGGELIVSVPNMAYWRMRWDLLLGRFDYTDTGLMDRTHLRFFTVKTFIETARNCGFLVSERIINDAGLPGFPNPVDWSRLPGWICKIVEMFPGLCVFHAIYRLHPIADGTD
ncbi:class I SAM-dependent methyltransferase [bacterium]|nr:class I SAM-dependent methyltransferase [bacterium]